MRHAFSRGRDGLHFADLGGIEEQGPRSGPARRPIQRLMIVLGIENRFLFLLRPAESRDDKLLEERDVQLRARRRVRRRATPEPARLTVRGPAYT